MRGMRSERLWIVLFGCALAGVFFGICMGQQVANSGYAGAPVGFSDRFFRVEAVSNGPLRPDPRDRRGGVDQDSVEIEKQSTARHLNHD